MLTLSRLSIVRSMRSFDVPPTLLSLVGIDTVHPMLRRDLTGQPAKRAMMQVGSALDLLAARTKIGRALTLHDAFNGGGATLAGFAVTLIDGRMQGEIGPCFAGGVHIVS